MSLVRFPCCQVEVTCDELITRSEESCRVSECDREAQQGEAMNRNRVELPKEKKVSVLYCKILLSNCLVQNSCLSSVVQTPGSVLIQKDLVQRNQ